MLEEIKKKKQEINRKFNFWSNKKTDNDYHSVVSSYCESCK